MRRKQFAVLAAIVLVVIVAAVNINRARHSATVAPPVPGPSAQPSRSARTVTDSLGCSAESNQIVTEEFGITIGPPTAVGIRADSSRCSDASGTRYPSAVRVVDDNDDGRAIATLVQASRGWHVYSLQLSRPRAAAVLTVTATDWARTDAGRGNLYRQSFSTTDGTSFSPGPVVLVAPVCTAGSLKLTAVTGVVSGSVIIRLQNIARTSCVLEGYPTVTASSALTGPPVSPPVATSELASRAGGVRHSTAPPVIVLAPGASASAATASTELTPAGGPTLCTSLRQISVALAAGPQLGLVSVSARVCGFEVHPLVPGITGSDA